MQSPASVVVMAGASCAGKSTLAERLLTGAMPDVASAIGLERGEHYHVLYGVDWSPSQTSRWPRTFIQYDITARTPFADRGIVRPEALEWLRNQQLVVLTVWEDPAELERRLELRFEQRGGLAWTLLKGLAKRGPRRARYSFNRYRQRQRLFRQPDDLWALYQAWFASCARLEGVPHWIVQSTRPDELRLLTDAALQAPFWQQPALVLHGLH
jgi:hypothetical protein